MTKSKKDPFKERQKALKDGIKDKGDYELYSPQKPSYLKATTIKGKMECRAPLFNKDVVIKVPNTKDKKDLILWWFKEGIRIFDIKDEFYRLEETNDSIYIYLFLLNKGWMPSIHQWFFFPGYTYFRRFLYLYRKIRNESKLNERRACVVASYIVCRKCNQEAAEFGNKFPFVANCGGSPIITRDVKAGQVFSTQMPIYSISIGDFRKEFSLNGWSLYTLPKVDIYSLSFDEIYLEIINQLEIGFNVGVAKASISYKDEALRKFIGDSISKIIKNNEKEIVKCNNQNFVPIDYNLFKHIAEDKRIQEVINPYKESILKSVVVSNYSLILNEKKELKKILETSNS